MVGKVCFPVRLNWSICGVQATPLLDKYLFNTFKKAFGGRVRFIVSGGAPLSTHVEEYLKVTLCTPVFQARTRFAHLLLERWLALRLLLVISGSPIAVQLWRDCWPEGRCLLLHRDTG